MPGKTKDGRVRLPRWARKLRRWAKREVTFDRCLAVAGVLVPLIAVILERRTDGQPPDYETKDGRT